MVQCVGSDKQLGERTVKAMSERRRQVICIRRKLPVSALRYLDSLQETNPRCAEAAFTIANLKAVPKMLTDEEGGALLRRMSNFYKTQIPVQKALPPHQACENVFYVRRAIKTIKIFMSLCEYTRLPAELKHTGTHESPLADCSYEGEQIYADLAQEWEKNVACGDLKLMIARKKIVSKKLESTSDQRYGDKKRLDQKCFEAAKKRIFDFASRPIKRSLSKSRFEGVAKHSAGILTFLKKAKPVTSKAGGSKRHEGTGHRDHDSRLGSEIVHSSPEAPPSRKGRKSYPDRHEIPTDEESNGSEDESPPKESSSDKMKICAAAEMCTLKSSNSPPTHSCRIFKVPLYNLCDYGKRVLKDFTREKVFACSKECYLREEQG